MRQTLWIVTAISLMLFFAQGAVARTIEDNAMVSDGKEIRAGVTPDSVFYFIDRFLDNRAIRAASDEAERSRISLEVARERLLEAREMLETNKAEAAQKAQQEHSRVLSVVERSISGIESDDALEQLEAEAEIEKELEEHDLETEFVKNELKLKLDIEGRLTPAQQGLIDSLLTNMRNQTGEVKVKIEEKRGETRIRLKAETGKSDSDIEREITEIETRTGLRELKIGRAEDKLEDASDEIAEAKLRLEQTNATNASLTAVTKLIGEAEEKLAAAQKAFDEGKPGEAFGLANSAENLARNANRIIQGFAEGGIRLEERLEIKANVMDTASEIRVKLEFTSAKTEGSEIAEELLEKLNLSSEELAAALKIERESEELEERLEAEARVRDGASSVKFELRFPLNATERSEIANGIRERLSRLTADELAASLDIRLRKDGEKEDEREIEVEVEEGVAKIKVEIGRSRLRYSIPFVSEADVVNDISLKTGLPEDEVRKLMKIEMEDDEEDEDDDDSRRGRGRG